MLNSPQRSRTPARTTPPMKSGSSAARARDDIRERHVFRLHSPEHAWLWAGYGIGIHAFRALGWVLLFSLLGAAVWRTLPEVRAAKKTWLWCFGAGLARVLPVTNLSKGRLYF